MDVSQFPTLLDRLTIDAGIGTDIIVQTVGKLRPEISAIPADTITGDSMQLTVLTELPTVAFRHLNQGTAGSKAKWQTKVFQTGLIDQPVQADRRAAEVSKDRGRFLAAQTMPFAEAVLNQVCKQFWYGVSTANGGDSKGFIGLIAQAESAATHVYDATGSSAKSSAWFLKTGTGGLQWLFGEGTYFGMDEGWKEETLYDANGLAFPGVTNWIKGRPGLRLANLNCAIRVKNIGTASGKTLTDATLFGARTLFDDLGVTPDVLVMSPRSREQLRASRTATNPTGAPAPTPTDWEGIPIVVSNHISNNETI